MFDDLAKDVASTLSGVFGGTLPYTRPGVFMADVPCVLRRDVEMYDDHDQVVARVHTLRIARKDITFVPKREDFVSKGDTDYTLGKRLSDDGYSYVFEVTT